MAAEPAAASAMLAPATATAVIAPRLIVFLPPGRVGCTVDRTIRAGHYEFLKPCEVVRDY